LITLRGGEANGAWVWYQFGELVSDTHGASTNSILIVLPLFLVGLCTARMVSPASDLRIGPDEIQKPADLGYDTSQ
jgi:hypothetical protein